MSLFGGPNIKKMSANGDVKGLIETLAYGKGNVQNKHLKVRKEAQKALVKIGASAVEPLIVALKDEYWQARAGAAETLAEIGDERTVEPFIIALNDEHEMVRQEAVEALDKFGGARAVEPLIATLKDKYWGVRDEAATALGHIGDARAVEPLIIALKDEHWSVRTEAATALGEIRDLRAIEPLKVALKDNDQFVRDEVAQAIDKCNERKFMGGGPTTYGITLSISQRDVSGLIRMLEYKKLDHDLEEMVRNALMDIGVDAMNGLFLALGDNQRMMGFNQLKQEGRVNDTVIRLSIERAVSDYRRRFE